jgi:hypothetical protein
MTVVVLGVVMGCGAQQHPPGMPPQQMVTFDTPTRPRVTPMGSSSSHGSPSSDDDDPNSFSNGKGLSVPVRSRTIGAAELVVRPDLLSADFAVREVGATSDAALGAAQARVAEIGKQLAQVTGGAAALKLRGVELAKVVRSHQYGGVSATVDGRLDVPLAETADFWARSRLLAAVLETTGQLSEAARSVDEPLRAVRFDDVHPTVQAPEGARARLIEKWVTEARAFAAAAESKGMPLSIVDCVPPQEITVARDSLEEATLHLSIVCRIDAGPGNQVRGGVTGRP